VIAPLSDVATQSDSEFVYATSLELVATRVGERPQRMIPAAHLRARYFER